MSGKVSI